MGREGSGAAAIGSHAVPARDLLTLTGEIISCRACPRLVQWREEVARDKRAAFRDEEYWGRPVPGFGDPRARLLVVGLAPAAHGGNRTGRVFTGDRSGDFLFAAMHRTDSRTRPNRSGPATGCGCATRTSPPRCGARRPRTSRRRTSATRACPISCASCSCSNVRVIMVLGAFGYEAMWSTLRAAALAGVELPARRPRFEHGLEVACGAVTIVGAFHPSQQNTFTGRLTPDMLDAVFVRAVVSSPPDHLTSASTSPTP